MTKKHTNEEIQVAANNIRKHILGITIDRNGCYLSQACSSAELLATMYMSILNITESEAPLEPTPFPGAPSKDNMDYLKGAAYNGKLTGPYDRFFISPAHYAAPVYATLIESGRLSKDALDKFNRDGYAMEMIGANHTPGFETAAGTLAQAYSVAAGTAHAKKLKGEAGNVYVMMSDGEMQEGQLWEAVQAAAFYKLDNLVLLVDVNGNQVEGSTEEVMNIEPIDARFKAFGATCTKVDGHDIEALQKAVTLKEKGKPHVVLCYTNPSQGISLLDNRSPMHFIRPKNEEEKEQFIELLNNWPYKEQAL